MALTAEYHAYINSPEWQAKRSVALERAGHRCQVCNGRKDLDVHHRTYERFRDELPEDLTVLCRKCHHLFHNNKTRRKRPKKRGSFSVQDRQEIAAIFTETIQVRCATEGRARLVWEVIGEELLRSTARPKDLRPYLPGSKSEVDKIMGTLGAYWKNATRQWRSAEETSRR